MNACYNASNRQGQEVLILIAQRGIKFLFARSWIDTGKLMRLINVSFFTNAKKRPANLVEYAPTKQFGMHHIE